MSSGGSRHGDGFALVTGSSQGLGAAIAYRLSHAGWPVAVNCRHGREAALRVVENVRSRGGEAILAQFDVTDASEVHDGLRTATAALGPVAVLVNNAAGTQPEIPLARQRWDDYLGQFEYFVKAPLLLLQEVMPSMADRHEGRIINIGSEVTTTAPLGLGYYVAGKSAMAGLTRAWARELAPTGITVNIVEPGWIPVAERGEMPDSPEFVTYAAGVPMRRVGSLEDVAGAVAYLASPEAGFVTGQRIVVNGGNTFT